MEKDLSRSLRRHHIERLKKTRKLYWGFGTVREGLMNPRQLGCVVQTPHTCSGCCCGNPRKHFKEITMQEHRHLDMLKITEE